MANDAVFEEFLGEPEESREFAQVCTYGGHPVACAAGLANLEILTEERLAENAERVGGYLLKNLKTLESLPIVGDVRGKGLMIGVELVKDSDGTQLDTATTKAICAEMLKSGIIVGRIGQTVDEPENIIFLRPTADPDGCRSGSDFETLQDVLTNL